MPLWEDLRDAAKGHLKGEAAPHFLGAIVIELVSADPGRVKEYSVIDGQQRLTTLQLLLAALGAVAAENRPEQVAEVRKLLLNEGKHATGDLRFKILPGEHDRLAFKGVLEGNGTAPTGKEGIPGAYEYFKEAIGEWVEAAESEERRTLMLDALQESCEGLLQVVSIRLDGSADAQVIFETLNSRGADLTSLDLAKNAIFRLAEKEMTKAEVAELRATYWQPALGDADYWLETVRQGRYTNERADLFLMHWLTMKLGKPARVQHLFADFRKGILKEDPPPTPRGLVIELSDDAKTFRSFDEFDDSSDEGRFFRRLRMLDTTTLLPVALLLFRDPDLPPNRRRRALRALESWLIRRMLLGATSAHYNRLLASLLETLNMQSSLATADAVVIASLRDYSNPTDAWPTDEQVLDQLRTHPLYGWISHKRIRLLLEACELQFAGSSKSEQLPFPEKLSIEHAMPRNWPKNWPLLPGSDDEAIAARNVRINRLGNLTLVTSGLNSSLSDSPWSVKRVGLAEHSQLLVNQRLCAKETWDDAAINARGEELAALIVTTWPGPGSPVWD